MTSSLEIMDKPTENLEISASAEMAEIFGALAKAQGEIKGAVKDVLNPFYKSKYADLSSVWEACREALSKNGLCVVQPLETKKDVVYVVTILGHSSGQWIKGRMPVFITEQKKSDPQAYGLAITYARRYCLAAMVGVAPEDDDGNAASNVTPPAAKATPLKRTAKAVSEDGGAIIRNLVLCSSVEDVDKYAKEVAAEVAAIARESSTVANTIKDQFAVRRDMLRQQPVSNGASQ